MISRLVGWTEHIERQSDKWLTYALLGTAVVLAVVALTPYTGVKAGLLAWAWLP